LLIQAIIVDSGIIDVMRKNASFICTPPALKKEDAISAGTMVSSQDDLAHCWQETFGIIFPSRLSLVTYLAAKAPRI